MEAKCFKVRRARIKKALNRFLTLALPKGLARSTRAASSAVALAAAFSIVAATSACNGSEKAETVSGSPNPAPTERAVPTGPATLAPTATATSESPATTDRLQKLVLQIDDLPSGWTTMPEDADDDDNTEICNRPPTSVQFKPSAYAEANYQQSDFGPFLIHVLASYSSNDARRAIDYVAEMLKSCSEWSQSNSDGTRVTYRLSPLSFPKLGDETFAVRMSTRDVPLFGTAQFDLVFWRRGTFISYMAYAAVGPSAATASPLEEMAKNVDARLSQPFR